ncbi:MAG: translation initiation factor IF-2 [Holosporales bacterium]|jgi:translation initiation factor IF-2|nr:translation initiation factor IF-2 [Holosporales bacterium]
MVNSNDGETKKRKTLSLKSNIEVHPTRYSPTNKTIEVEIKRKKCGLAITIDTEENSTTAKGIRIDERGGSHEAGNLTDSEFKARVEALQNAIKSDERVRSNEIEAKNDGKSYVWNDRSNIDVAEPNAYLRSQSREEQGSTAVKRTSVREFKKKETVLTSPVVFRADDYVKKSPVFAKDGQATPGSQQQQKFATQQDSSGASDHYQHKQKERGVDDVDSSKKRIKLIVRDKGSEKRERSSGKMSRALLSRVLNTDTEERARSIASLKRARQKLKNTGKEREVVKVVREVNIPDIMTVGELANRMAVRSADVVKYLMSTGTMATINQTIDGDTAEIICTEFGHTPKRVSEADVENELENIVDSPADMETRPPVVAVMGHVDHGKTTLLDTLRKASVAQKEVGGITQHVTAYQVETESGKKITFIDTPGHAAFSSIRTRGTNITDMIVLVVAADDGIKEQAVEVIKQAKSRNVPIIVAINKIDKPDINIEKIKSELMAHEVVLEDFGGETLSVAISAKQNINIDGLIEAILLQAEVMDLKASKVRKATGTILEARVDKGKGVIASVIMQHGIIREGDIFVAGSVFGKVRMLLDDDQRITFACPGSPVEIVGFNATPESGDILTVVDSEQKAREIAEYRVKTAKSKFDTAFAKPIEQMMGGDKIQILNVLVKADVYGSLEAVAASLEAIDHKEVAVKVVEKAIGVINEGDVAFSKNTNAVIVGFNVNVSPSAKELARANNVKILRHSIIYRLTEDVKTVMSTMLAPTVEENYIGRADVKKIFVVSKLGTIAGCYVTDGVIKKNDSKIKVIRNGICIFEGKIRSMKHERDEIKESQQSHECGILADGYNNFNEGDQIECYEIVLKSRYVD